MKKYFNKFTMSIIMVVLSALTMVATTYAWVGLATNSTTDNFTLNLKEASDNDSDYGIELSLDGINFYDSIPEVSIKKAILKNLGYSNDALDTDNKVREAFRRHHLTQCTTTRNSVISAYYTGFYNMDGRITTNYYQFPLYLSIYKIDSDGNQGIDDNTKYLDVFLRDEIMTSDPYEYKLANEITFPSVNPVGETILSNPSLANSIALGSKLNTVYVRPSSATRLGIQKHKTVDKGHPEQYNESDNIQSLTIFQTDEQYPTYDSTSNVYAFGGVLPKDYNVAYLDYTQLHDDNLQAISNAVDFNNVLNRGDITFKDDGVSNHIVKESDQVSIKKMIKFTITFWFEGWDSDCFAVVDQKPVNLSMSFSTKNPND